MGSLESTRQRMTIQMRVRLKKKTVFFSFPEKKSPRGSEKWLFDTAIYTLSLRFHVRPMDFLFFANLCVFKCQEITVDLCKIEYLALCLQPPAKKKKNGLSLQSQLKLCCTFHMSGSGIKTRGISEGGANSWSPLVTSQQVEFRNCVYSRLFFIFIFFINHSSFGLFQSDLRYGGAGRRSFLKVKAPSSHAQPAQ